MLTCMSSIFLPYMRLWGYHHLGILSHLFFSHYIMLSQMRGLYLFIAENCFNVYIAQVFFIHEWTIDTSVSLGYDTQDCDQHGSTDVLSPQQFSSFRETLSMGTAGSSGSPVWSFWGTSTLSPTTAALIPMPTICVWVTQSVSPNL